MPVEDFDAFKVRKAEKKASRLTVSLDGRSKEKESILSQRGCNQSDSGADNNRGPI